MTSTPISSEQVRRPTSGSSARRERLRNDASPAPTTTTSGRGRLGRLTGFRIAGTGSYAPQRIVTNEDLAALGCDSDWIVRRTGIRQRRVMAEGETTSDMAYQAAMDCLKSAGRTADEVDLIIVATMTSDYPTPSTACQLQERLGALAPAMDVNAACAGFVYALITAGQFVASGNHQCVLVVGADAMNGTVDPSDKKTYPLFGDAAGAVLLVPDDATVGNDAAMAGDSGQDDDVSLRLDPAHPNGFAADGSSDDRYGLLSYQLGSEGSGGDLLQIKAGGSKHPLTPEQYACGGQYFRMDGRAVFKWAVRVIEDSGKDVLGDAGVSADQIDWVVLHQANQRILDASVAALNIAGDKALMNLDRYGNTSAASIPLVLDEASKDGRLKRDDLVLISGFGAGLAWGTAVLRW
ncbi:beta-ketoacyl-ACP synthase III [Crateriforma conspicua]|uniref:beta-ketoacyl-ACP synthase III n=1 Tax=Crateriforma conspicua TaxID=2527996 RepID=UPI00118C16E3|nr:beta-ketoacyl-ACP synthase III [Crateriforma conspicua]QDV62809.1 3-oxoacyl-[acyl-carrier-protein] synthase 3 [Crateriforma conspicua]